MKKFLMVISVLLFGCEEKGTPKETNTDGDFRIEFLFEKDGCKVYRFRDGSRYIYWANCQGKIQADYETGSKHKIYHKEETIMTALK
jgi:hypothetical protein